RGAGSEAPGGGGGEIMLRMDGFEVHAARTPEEAVSLFGSLEDAHYVAGGTDLVPNLKHRIVPARHLVSLSTALPRGWGNEKGEWGIGAGPRLRGVPPRR